MSQQRVLSFMAATTRTTQQLRQMPIFSHGVRRMTTTTTPSSQQTATTTIATTTTTKSTSTPTPLPPRPPMAWASYFDIRKQRSRSRLIWGIPATVGSIAGMVGFVSFDPMTPIMGIDPAMLMALGTIGAGVAGYQVGAGTGQLVWRTMKGEVAKQKDVMDKIFYKKIAHYRADKQLSPYAQPGKPQRADYYGERIKTVKDYREWLKRQRKLHKDSVADLTKDPKPIRGLPLGTKATNRVTSHKN